VVLQSVPLFARVLLGQMAAGSSSSGWGLLKCPSACRRHTSVAFSAKAVLAQLASSSVAACGTAFLLLRAAQAAAALGNSTGAAAGAAAGAGAASGAVAAASGEAWWHTLVVLVSALAAAVCDTARSVRRGEHELQFPTVAADPEPGAALAAFLRGALPRLLLGAAKSAAEWALACAAVALVALPAAARCALFVLPRVLPPAGVGGDAHPFWGDGAGTSPAWLTALDDVAARPWQTCVPPLRVSWRAAVCYAANYLLLQHGPALLAKVLTTPLDFNRAAGYPPGDASGGGGVEGRTHGGRSSSGSGSVYGGGGGGGGGPDEQAVAGGELGGPWAADGATPAAELLVATLRLGWRRALEDPDQRLSPDQEGPTGSGLGGFRAAGGGPAGGGPAAVQGSHNGVGGGGSGGLGLGLRSGGPGDGGARAELDWVKIVNRQRRLASGLRRRLQQQQVLKLSSQKRGLGAAFRRLLGDLVRAGRDWVGACGGRASERDFSSRALPPLSPFFVFFPFQRPRER
jgi:hypothetical protein